MEIKKKLFQNVGEFVQFVLTTNIFHKHGIEAVEEFLGIEFEMGNSGVFPSDQGQIPDSRYDAAEELETNLNSWRVTDGWNMPVKAPFLFVYIIESTSDRFGKVDLSLGNYVYLDDFQ